jgi:hypothetical protein
MHYTQPKILTTTEAASNIMGVDPSVAKGESPAIDNFNTMQHTQLPAYEADE